jgi:MtN3 and saliva related transmembrane protein
MFWEMIGIAATLCILSSYVPQIVKSYRTKSMKDFSLLYLLIIALGVFLWILYGVHIGDQVVIYANVTLLAFTAALIVMRIHYSGFR